MDKNQKLEAILKKIDIFSSLKNSELELLKNNMNLISFRKGDLICREGEPGDKMYIIISGKVSVFKRSGKGKMTEIISLGAGSVVGIMSLFEEKPRSATLKAVTMVKAWEIGYSVFNKLLKENPEISKNMLRVLSRFLRKGTRTVADLISSDEDNRMKIAFFDSKPYTEKIFTEVNNDKYHLKFFKPRVSLDTVMMAAGYKVITAFVNDKLNSKVIEELGRLGVEMIALRCAGFNNVDIEACRKNGISVARVPAYSPHAVAEHAIALILALNRHIHKAASRIRDGNFSLDGLVGFDIYGKTVGIIGTGKIGKCAVSILKGFGCRVLAYDKFPDPVLAKKKGVEYVNLEELFVNSDIISLHAPLTQDSYHMINRTSINKMKPGVMIINTSRGGLIDTKDLINGLKKGQVGSAGLDVYEEESSYFFEDYSDSIINDDMLARLITFNNVMITSHMAFLTKEALANIAMTTFKNINEYEIGKSGKSLTNSIY